MSATEGVPLPQTPPGPSGWEVLRNFRDIFGRPLHHWRRWQDEYGDAVRVPLGPETLMFFFHPEHVEHVLQTHQRRYGRSGYGYDVLRLVQGDGLLTSDGALWRRQRRLMQPVFHRRNLERFAPTVVRLTRRMLERWEGHCDRDEPVDIYREMIALAVQVMGEVLASMDLSGRLEELEPARDACNEEVTLRMTDPLSPPLWLPTARNRRFKDALATFDRMSYEMIAERRQEGERPHDILTLMMAARDEDSGEAMPEKLLRDEIVTLAGAGNETSGLSLTWLFYELARHPEARARLYQEVADVLGDRDPGVDDVPKLGYLRQAFEEALRLYPPIYGVPRQATEEDIVGGYWVPRGTNVLLSQYVTQRHPDFWEAPDEFRPEHFDEDAVAARHRYAAFPFGGGSHLCIGKGLALMDAALTVSLIAQRFELERADDEPVGIRAGITIRPDRRIWMRLRRVA